MYCFSHFIQLGCVGGRPRSRPKTRARGCRGEVAPTPSSNHAVRNIFLNPITHHAELDLKIVPCISCIARLGSAARQSGVRSAIAKVEERGFGVDLSIRGRIRVFLLSLGRQYLVILQAVKRACLFGDKGAAEELEPTSSPDVLKFSPCQSRPYSRTQSSHGDVFVDDLMLDFMLLPLFIACAVGFWPSTTARFMFRATCS